MIDTENDMAKLEWEKRTRLEKPRELPWDSRLERQANRILGGLVTPPPKQSGGTNKRVLRAREKKAAPIDEDIWVVFGADCPWNPTPGERLVKHFKTRAEEQAFRRKHGITR